MARDDWYRNTRWTQDIATAFDAKLKRARRKDEYLRVQAITIAPHEPRVALDLSTRYFDVLGDKPSDPTIYDAIARAQVVLGDFDAAIAAYETATTHMKQHPNIKTNAALDLCFLVAEHRIAVYYNRAIELLGYPPHAGFFPIIAYRHYAAKAAILWEIGNRERAAEQACRALIEAEREQSGLRYHPKLGLFGDEKSSKAFFYRIVKISGRQRSLGDLIYETWSGLKRILAR